MTEPRNLEFKVTPIQPDVLLSLSPPEKVIYFSPSFPSSSSFCWQSRPSSSPSRWVLFGYHQFPLFPNVPPPSLPTPFSSSLGTSSCSSWRIYSLLHHLAALVPPQGPPHCSSSFSRWGTEPCPYLPHTLIPGLELPTFPWDVLALSPSSLGNTPTSLPSSPQTRQAHFHGNQRKAQISSRLAMGFSISSILVR